MCIDKCIKTYMNYYVYIYIDKCVDEYIELNMVYYFYYINRSFYR